MFLLWISMCLQSLMKFHHCLFKILRKNQNVVDKELQRAITLTELAPIPYFSIINNHLVDINVFAKFDKIPSLPAQVINEKSKCCGLRITKPLFFYYKCSSYGYQCVCQILWNSVIAFSRYWKTKMSQTDKGTTWKQYTLPSQTQFAGYN